MSIRVVIADDQELVRMGFRMVIDSQPDLSVVGEAADGERAAALAAQLDPDVVLMDVRMPGLDGVDGTRLIARGSSRTRVIILTTFDLDEYVHAALRAGASGFLLKDAQPADLLSAIRAVAAGEAFVAPRILRRLLDSHPLQLAGEDSDPGTRERLATLTAREHEVLGLVARGHSNAEIAAELFLSEATVKSHVSRLLAKLELRDRVQIVVFAYESGVVAPGEEDRGPGSGGGPARPPPESSF